MEISFLQPEERLKIKATFYSLTDDEFRCQEKEALLSQRPDAELQIKNQRREKSCGVISDEVKVEIDNWGFYSCLCHEDYKYHGMNHVVFLYNHYKKGVMPFKGCLTEQPNYIIDIFNLLDELYKEYDEKQAPKSEK